MTAQASAVTSITDEVAVRPAITLCHFSTAHAQIKSRSFHRQCMPLAETGMNMRYVTPANITGQRDGVDFVPLQRPRRGLRSLFSLPTLVRILLQQNANLYHFQDPELLPLALAMKLIFKKRVVYDAYED